MDLQETIVAKKEQRWEWWEDREFVAYLDRIEMDVKEGKVVGKSWEEVKADADALIAGLKSRRNAA